MMSYGFSSGKELDSSDVMVESVTRTSSEILLAGTCTHHFKQLNL